MSINELLPRLPGALLVCLLGVVGCGVSDGESEWVTFSAESIVLELPNSFVGGDPADPEAMGALEGIAAQNPNPVFREELELFLDAVKQEGETIGHQLILWGEPDADGYMPMVEAGRMEAMPVGMSLERWIGVLMGGYHESEWSFEQAGDAEAQVVLARALDDGRVVTRSDLYKVAGVHLYIVRYTSWDAEMEAVFGASAETVKLHEDRR